QFDMAHALATHLRARDLHTALVTDDALMPHTLIFAACALPILGRSEDALAEESVLFRLERAIVDSFWLGHLAIAPGANLLRAGQADADGVKIVDFEHWLRLKATRYRTLAPCSFPNVGLVLPTGQCHREKVPDRATGSEPLARLASQSCAAEETIRGSPSR